MQSDGYQLYGRRRAEFAGVCVWPIGRKQVSLLVEIRQELAATKVQRSAVYFGTAFSHPRTEMFVRLRTNKDDMRKIDKNGSDGKLPPTLTDEQIVTEKVVPRRSFLSATGAALMGGAAALILGRAVSAQPQDPDKAQNQDPDKPKPKDPDKSKPEDPDKSKPEDPDKPRPQDPDRQKAQDPDKPRPQDPDKARPKDPDKPKPKDPDKSPDAAKYR